MESESFDRSLRAFCRRTPFKSFTVELSSGEPVAVEHPEAVVYRSGVAVYFAPDGAITIFDHPGFTRMVGAPNNQATPA